MTAMRDRSMNSEMLEGSVDGTYKRFIMNRSNLPDPDRLIEIANKMALSAGGGSGYGIFEAPEKRTPDGRFVR
jgi:hypothetical protein